MIPDAPEWLNLITCFIAQGAPAQCAELLDKRADVSECLKKLDFSGQLRPQAFQFVALIVNSQLYAQWASLFFTSRAPHLTPSAIQLLPSAERLVLVKHCLALINTTQGCHAVAHLVAYTKDFKWYINRGAVPDGKRSWRLWRLVTQHRALLNIAKRDHWHIIRALLATCPEGALPSENNAILSKADKAAIQVLLNPPDAELVKTALELAQKVDPHKTTVSNISPEGEFSHLILEEMSIPSSQITKPCFAVSRFTMAFNFEFLTRLIDIDNENGRLLMPPCSDLLFWNPLIFARYSQRVGSFLSIITQTTSSYRVTKGQKGDTYAFCVSGLVGLFKICGDAIEAMRLFLDLSKRLFVGPKPKTIWNLLWDTDHTIKSSARRRKRCFGQLLGPKTYSGGLFNPTLPSFDDRALNRLFCWWHDVMAAFTSNPYAKIVAHLSGSHHFSESTKVKIGIFHNLIVDIHHRHPDIGPHAGRYHKIPVYSKNITKAIKLAPGLVKKYLQQWYLPLDIRSLPVAHLKFRLPHLKKRKIFLFLLAACRRGSSGEHAMMPPEILNIILTFFL